MAVKVKDVVDAFHQGLRFAGVKKREIDIINSCLAEAGVKVEFFFEIGSLKVRDVVEQVVEAPAEPVAT